MLAAAFGMAGPVLIGVLSGQVPAGFTAALGGLAVGGVEAGAAFSVHARRELQALAPVLLAALLAVAAGGHGWLAELLLILTALIAAAIGGFSRLMAVATTRFILFLMIVSAMPAAAFDQRAGFLALIALGALWTSMLGFAFGIVARKNALVPQQEPQQRRATWTQKLKRWAQSMRNVDGWNYTIRLGACLLVALAATLLWPDHHLHWISITAALLISRTPEPTSLKTTQRTLGTAVGVVLSALVLRSTLPAAVLVVAVGVLAGARPLLRNGNYLVYSAAMTPLIILIIDAGHVPDSGLLVDRLIATLIGAALVVGTNLLMMRFVSDRKPIS
ncbi:FUSC family protein [Pollutimonas bauzanensis]|uniref:Fusaric acid resistance protein-like n=1 Tax=Pollutimonas bauzanensis TaxID=658167 RepID=A0A1M6BLF2_9BURK|nr:FUSC family protein [Pollutimonas bauzanensis]SHI49640.1 Fusaric acid resistance protein-like [Pollutimonas bauzanensis]